MKEPLQKGHPRELWAVGAITFAALLIRLPGLGTLSYWYDEGATLSYAMGGPGSWITDTHPPLYYALAHFWLKFGQSEFWLRLLSVIFAVTTIPVIYGIGKKLFNSRSGMLAAAFMSVLAFHVDQSQQARMYSLLVFLYSCALWSLIAAARYGERRHWLTYAISSSLLAYSQGIGFIYVALIACLFPVICPDRKRLSAWAPFIIANIAVLVSFVPWLLELLALQNRMTYLNWIARPGLKSIPRTVIAFLFRYLLMPSFEAPKSSARTITLVGLTAVMLVPTVAILYISFRRTITSQRWWAGATACLAMVLPILAVFSISVFYRSLYIDRVMLPATVGMVLILGASFQGTARTSTILRGMIVAALLIASLNTFFLLRYRVREDFRALSQDLQLLVKPGEPILFVADSGFPRFLIEHYDPLNTLAPVAKLDLLEILRNCQGIPDTCRSADAKLITSSHQLWIVYSHDEAFADKDAVHGWLDSHFSPISQKSYQQSLRLEEVQAVGEVTRSVNWIQ